MDLCHLSALDLSAKIKARAVSPVEVMRAALDRIAETNGAVNAIVSIQDEDVLMGQARAAEDAPSKGWLHGLPVAVKDLAHAQGYPTSMGSPLFKGTMPERDDIHIARMRAAGAIVIGKTNTPEFGLGSHTFNPVFGATKNPYDTARSAGGSSGGAGVALACGMIPIADGSDMMGSLRNPAAWNNVYGMRPTTGLVPTEPRGDTYLQHLATMGPMARCPADLAALLDTMAGPDPRQPFSVSLPNAVPQLEADVTGRKIGWLGDWGGAYAMEPGLMELSTAALEQMEALGLHVEALAPPCGSDAIWEPWMGLRHYAIACGLGAAFETPSARGQLKDTAQWEIEAGLALSGREINRLSALRSDWFTTAATLFETYDMLVLPSAQVWPFAVEDDYPREINGVAMDTYHRWMEVVIPASLIGLPVVNVPIGFGENGLPAGLQLIGPRGSDARLLQVAQRWHAATDWPKARRPVGLGGA